MTWPSSRNRPLRECFCCHETKGIVARDLCDRCYDRHQKAGTLHLYPATRKAKWAEDVAYIVEDLIILQQRGESLEKQAAAVGYEGNIEALARRLRRRGHVELARPFEALCAQRRRDAARVAG